jgi:hypothetical protein
VPRPCPPGPPQLQPHGPPEAEAPTADPLRDRRLHLIVALSYGAICGAGAASPLLGIALIIVFAAAASARALFRGRWLLGAVAMVMIATTWVPSLGVAIGLATLLLLCLRVAFVVRNLRVVVAGLIVYAVALAWIVLGGHWMAALADTAKGSGVGSAAASWLTAPLAGCLAALLMAGVLHVSYRGRYSTARTLEVISLIPLLLIGTATPFLDHAAALTAWESGSAPVLQGLFRWPPVMTEIFELARHTLHR